MKGGDEELGLLGVEGGLETALDEGEAGGDEGEGGEAVEHEHQEPPLIVRQQVPEADRRERHETTTSSLFLALLNYEYPYTHRLLSQTV